jgi:hypothetical protein
MIRRKHVDREKAIEAYKRLNCSRSAAAEMGICQQTMLSRLREWGVEVIPRRTWKRSTGVPLHDVYHHSLWGKEILARDGYRCMVCGETGKVVPHHILPWGKYADLRFDLNNGITLCKECHYITYKREEEYAHIFQDLLEVCHDIMPKYENKLSTEMPTEVACLHCKATKPVSDFVPHKIARWGFIHVCKMCHTRNVNANLLIRQCRQGRTHVKGMCNRHFFEFVDTDGRIDVAALLAFKRSLPQRISGRKHVYHELELQLQDSKDG